MTLGVPGDSDPILDIPRVSLDFALLRLLHGWRGAIYQLHLDSPSLRLQKPLGGEWTFLGLFDNTRFAALVSRNSGTSPPNTRLSADLLIDPSVAPEDVMRLDWIVIDKGTIEIREEIAGQSDGTTTEVRFAEIRIDETNLRARDVIWPASQSEHIQTWQIQGRIGTGQIRLSSAGNLLNFRPPRPDEGEWGQTNLVSNPRLQGTLTLQRFSATTLSRLLPGASLVDMRSEVSGPVNFELFERTFLRLDAPELHFEGVE